MNIIANHARKLSLMHSRMRFLVVVAAIGSAPVVAVSQIESPSVDFAGVSASHKVELERERSDLVKQHDSLQSRLAAHNAECTDFVDETKVRTCSDNQSALLQEIRRYNDEVRKFNDALEKARIAKNDRGALPPVAPDTGGGMATVTPCELAETQAAELLNSIEKERGFSETNQEQLREWTQLGKEGLQDLVKDSLKAAFGLYAADSDAVREEAEKLENAAQTYASRAFGSTYNTSRMADLAALRQKLGEIDAMRGLVARKTIFNPDTVTAWDVSRDSMHNAFRSAAQSNSQFAKLVDDPEFRSSLLGPPDEDPQRALVEATISETSQLLARRALDLRTYESFTGPTVRVLDFVFSAALDDLKISLSADRVDQANTNAGVLVQHAGVLQKRYKVLIDRARECHSRR
jgi:hypothetical protein